MKNKLTEEQEVFDLVYADPPWYQKKGGLRGVRPNQQRELDYKTLSLVEIKEILDVFKKSSILFLWTIDKYLFDAEKIANDLGYKLHARIIWDKTNGVAPAFTVRFAHEYLLWFYRGKFLPINKKYRGKFTSVIRERSTKHSKKPIRAYKFIESIYPKLSKIELFARNKRVGWYSWGHEIDSTEQVYTKPLPEKEFSCICGNQMTIVFVGIKPFNKIQCENCKRKMVIPN